MMSTPECLQEQEQSEVKQNLSRLRRVAPEKFRAFIFMHLSMLLDLDGDKLDRLASEKKASNTPFSLKKSSEKPPVSLDSVRQLLKLINRLSSPDILKTDGLFRKSGTRSRQAQLRQLLDKSEDAIDAVRNGGGSFTAHDFAHLLKTLLSELPEPLLTERHIEAHRQIAEMATQSYNKEERARATERRVRALQLLFQLLPQTNQTLAECLLLLLHRVVQHPENRMTAASLGTVFAPHLLCSKKLSPSELHEASSQFAPAVAFMVEHAKELFEVPEVLAMDVNQYWKKLELEEINLSKNYEAETPRVKKQDSGPALTSVVTYTTRRSREELEAISKEETERQLASLYAHVQAMPQSAEKKKLLHKFNKASNSESKKKVSRSRSIGASLIKHLRPRSKSRHKLDDSCQKSLIGDLNDSAVHIVDIGDGERQIRPRKRRSDEDLDHSRPAKERSQEQEDLRSSSSHGLRRQPVLRSLPSVENEIHKLPRNVRLPSIENEIVHLRPKLPVRAKLGDTPPPPPRPPRPHTFHVHTPRTPLSNCCSPKARTPLLQINSGFRESSL